MAAEHTSGRVTFLRVNDVGTGFGPSQDHLDVEAVIRLDSRSAAAFGFQLRQDGNVHARRCMLALIRDAFKHNRLIEIDYTRPSGKNNGLISRVTHSTLPEPQISEVAGPLIAAAEPIANGLRLDPKPLLAQFPDPPPGEDVPGLLDKTHWLPEVQRTLAAGESHEIEVPGDEPSLLLVRVSWFNSTVPVEVTVRRNDVVLATGEATVVPPNRGTVILKTETDQTGDLLLVVRNSSRGDVDIEAVVGVLPLSIT